MEDIYNNAKYIIADEVSFNCDDLKLIDDIAEEIPDGPVAAKVPGVWLPGEMYEWHKWSKTSF